MATRKQPARKPVKTAATKRPAPLHKRVQAILEQARDTAALSVNTAQVVANWLVGREIVEDEQRGSHKAGYGKRLLQQLSGRLQREYGGGYSVDNLELFRRFFLNYPSLLGKEISDAVRRKSLGASDDEGGTAHHAAHHEFGQALPAKAGAISDAPRRKSGSPHQAWKPGRLNTGLSWTHYRTLLRVEGPQARSFYEIEAVVNAWSARELERQINSLLFERLARSKDKKGLMRLARKGQEIMGPADVFKDPMVIEFLGLPRNTRVQENDLEGLLITNLQDFLLRLREAASAEQGWNWARASRSLRGRSASHWTATTSTSTSCSTTRCSSATSCLTSRWASSRTRTLARSSST